MTSSEAFAAELKKADLWQEFSDRKAALISEGCAKKQAYVQAKDEFLAKLDGETNPQDDGANGQMAGPDISEELATELEQRNGKRAKDIDWVYTNLARKTPNYSTAPSLGAVGLHRWARRREDFFYRDFVAKTLRPEADQEKSFVDDGGATKLLDDFLDSLHERFTEGDDTEESVEAG